MDCLLGSSRIWIWCFSPSPYHFFFFFSFLPSLEGKNPLILVRSVLSITERLPLASWLQKHFTMLCGVHSSDLQSSASWLHCCIIWPENTSVYKNSNDSQYIVSAKTSSSIYRKGQEILAWERKFSGEKLCFFSVSAKTREILHLVLHMAWDSWYVVTEDHTIQPETSHLSMKPGQAVPLTIFPLYPSSLGPFISMFSFKKHSFYFHLKIILLYIEHFAVGMDKPCFCAGISPDRQVGSCFVVGSVSSCSVLEYKWENLA